MKNFFIATSIFIVVLLMSGCSKNTTPQQTSSDSTNTNIEEVYNSSVNLPQHNTVCFPTKKFLCTSDNCTTEEKPSVFILIGSSIDGPKMSRCDRAGCDTYDAVMEKGGEYINAQTKDPRGLIFKMSFSNNALNNQNEFVEVVTLGLNTQVSYGYCKFRNN